MSNHRTYNFAFIIATLVALSACAPADTSEPRICCAAYTAECLACAAGTTAEDYCATHPDSGVCGGSGALVDELIECAEPRQVACTKEYNPVCGTLVLNTGETRHETFGNGCMACAEMKATGYVPGECATDTPAEVPPCAATLCEYGATCVEGRGCVAFTQCEDPRPEICTMDYNPVCAAVDNGIRCITQPCPSIDWKTYSTGCTACSDANVAGHTPGACNPEIDNNPSDDVEIEAPGDVPPCAATLCEYGSTCIEGQGCVPAASEPGRLAFTRCEDPRPEACTLDYTPVCAIHDDDSRTTAGNACGACGDATVVGYWPGECEQPPSDTPNSFCDASTPCPDGQECWVVPGGETPQCVAGTPACGDYCAGECVALESYPPQLRCVA